MTRAAALLTTAILALSLLAACGEDDVNGDDDHGFEIEDQILQGKIDGEEWVFSSGSAEESSFQEGWFRVKLYAGTDEPCGFGTPSGADDRSILSSFPGEPGEYELGITSSRPSVTFTYPDGGTAQNMVATRGLLVIDEVTTEKMSGALIATFDVDHEVDGTFELTRCDAAEPE